MDLFDGWICLMVIDDRSVPSVQQDVGRNCGGKLGSIRPARRRSKLWRETFNNETTVKGNLCRLTDAKGNLCRLTGATDA
jgi:hypothetical protein